MEKELKSLYFKFGVAIEITIWVFLVYYINSNAIFEDYVVGNVLIIMVEIVLLHIIAYDIALIVKIVIEKKVSKIENVKVESHQVSEICLNCGIKLLDKTGDFCSKCGAPIK